MTEWYSIIKPNEYIVFIYIHNIYIIYIISSSFFNQNIKFPFQKMVKKIWSSFHQDIESFIIKILWFWNVHFSTLLFYLTFLPCFSTLFSTLLFYLTFLPCFSTLFSTLLFYLTFLPYFSTLFFYLIFLPYFSFLLFYLTFLLKMPLILALRLSLKIILWRKRKKNILSEKMFLKLLSINWKYRKKRCWFLPFNHKWDSIHCLFSAYFYM